MVKTPNLPTAKLLLSILIVSIVSHDQCERKESPQKDHEAKLGFQWLDSAKNHWETVRPR